MSGYGTTKGWRTAQIQMQRDVNQQNREMHSEDIATQYALQDKANAFTREQFAAENAEWDRRQAATSPAATRKLYEEAGLNPYIMLGNSGAGIGQTGSISSKSAASGSVPSASPMQAISGGDGTGPLDIIMAVLNGAIQPIKALSDYKTAKAQSEKTGAEANIAQSDAMVRDTRNRLELAKMYQDFRKSNFEGDRQAMENFVFGNSLDSMIRKNNSDADAAEATARKINLEEKALSAGLPFIAPQALANLNNTVQDTMLKAAQKNLSKRDAVLRVQQTITEQLKQNGVRLDNRQKEKLLPIVVDQALEDVKNKQLINYRDSYEAQRKGKWTFREEDNWFNPDTYMRYIYHTFDDLTDLLEIIKIK